MALPKDLKSARLTDSSIANTIDNALGDAEKAVADILGITPDTNVTANNLPAKFSGGLLFVPSCHATRTASQSIPDNTITAIAFDSERWDNDVMHDNATNNNRITIQSAGKYVIGAQVEFTAGSGLRELYIRKNGTTEVALNTLPSTAGFQAGMAVATIVDCAAADYFEIRVVQNSGGSLSVLGGSTQQSPEFWAYRVGV